MRFIALGLIVASASALGYALYSQYYQGFHPCELCIWQRYGFCATIFFAAVALVYKPKIFVNLASLAMLATGAIAAYHFGIEQKWWVGFQTCSSPSAGGSAEDLLAEIMTAPVVRCDEATWFFLGLSMAGWNVIYSGGLGVLALILGRKKYALHIHQNTVK